MDMLITTEWLAERLGEDDLRVLDASYHMGGTGRDPATEFDALHIPGAGFMDLAALSDRDAEFDNTIPPAQHFERGMRALGISADTHVVLYDNSPLHSAMRGWFLMRLFGHARVAVLDGGLHRWNMQGRGIERGTAKACPSGDFMARLDETMLRDKQSMLDNLDSRAAQIVDARSAARFTGQDPEPREDVASGHIPRAKNVPIGMLFEGDGRMKDMTEIQGVFQAAGLDLEKPFVTSCGSGVTAAVLSFALELLGTKDVSLYDGSWAEWGSSPDTPKAKGLA
ncbi:3-mercaptopyruvate sulfurtransferase [uncultured Croceicoccus sp.]|uniref:3-mercaptopyruvate sulfurtransferase n=1 Tax=uncultured Croceicoccus sp. TaxID=1295329 RepID=UPI002631652A|nr:3-mercaptopyruvate sulfurtransferase [uncultured Croceicoccus sp.]